MLIIYGLLINMIYRVTQLQCTATKSERSNQTTPSNFIGVAQHHFVHIIPLYSSVSSKSTMFRAAFPRFTNRLAVSTLTVSLAATTTLLYKSYSTASVIHADASELRGFQQKPSKRSILHGRKWNLEGGILAEEILKRCEETHLKSGPGVWRYDINQIARFVY